MATCLLWKEQSIKKCVEEADQGYKECIQEADQGYNICSEEADKGYSKCSKWGKFSWLCKAWTWITNIVCIAWTWIKNIVCIAWTWVKKMVCILWVYLRTTVCLIWINIEKVWDFLKDIFRHLWWTIIYILSKIKCYVLANPIEKDGWTLIFNDEFDNSTLDTTNKWQTRANFMVRPTLPPNPWGVYPFYDVTNPLQYFDNSCFLLNNSVLTITSEYDPKSFDYTNPSTAEQSHWDIDYKSGWLETLQAFHYGFFEIRCKIPDASGSWPAFWFIGDPWPPEIDVFEFFTSDFTKSIQKTNIHWGSSKADKKQKSKGYRICDAGKDFNIYGFEWREGHMKWYFNNVLIRTEREHMNEFIYPMKLIVGSGMEDYFSNPAIINGLPHKFEIDYVRIYK
jgi:beta-glucanase (GH16 family)